MVGGSGTDAVTYFGSPVRIQVDLAINCGGTVPGPDTPYQQFTCGRPQDTGSNGWAEYWGDVENIEGTQANDYLAGSIVDNVIYGRGGDDDIRGMEGNDALYGGPGNDDIEADWFDDVWDQPFGECEGGPGNGITITVNPPDWTVPFGNQRVGVPSGLRESSVARCRHPFVAAALHGQQPRHRHAHDKRDNAGGWKPT